MENTHLLHDFVEQKQSIPLSMFAGQKRVELSHYQMELAWDHLPIFFSHKLKRLNLVPILVTSKVDDEYISIHICPACEDLQVRTTPTDLVSDGLIASIELIFVTDEQVFYEIDFALKPSNSFDVLEIGYGDDCAYTSSASEFPAWLTYDNNGIHLSFSFAGLLCLCYILENPAQASSTKF